MNIDYDKIGNPVDRVTEEAAELILAISKCKRFGFFAVGPGETKDNYALMIDEVEDLQRKLVDMSDYLMHGGFKREEKIRERENQD